MFSFLLLLLLFYASIPNLVMIPESEEGKCVINKDGISTFS